MLEIVNLVTDLVLLLYKIVYDMFFSIVCLWLAFVLLLSQFKCLCEMLLFYYFCFKRFFTSRYSSLPCAMPSWFPAVLTMSKDFSGQVSLDCVLSHTALISPNFLQIGSVLQYSQISFWLFPWLCIFYIHWYPVQELCGISCKASVL